MSFSGKIPSGKKLVGPFDNFIRKLSKAGHSESAGVHQCSI